MDDLQAVVDAVGLERVALMGAMDAGLCAMYAATYPDRVTALVLMGISPTPSEWLTGERREGLLEVIESGWGEGRLLEVFAPSRAGDPRFREWWTRFERAAVTPSMARKIFEMNSRIDLREILPAIRVPTLVLHRAEAGLVPVEKGREAADLIPDARFVEVPGTDAYGWPDVENPANDEIEEFLTGRRLPRETERVLATVLFTDIVGSTDRASELGDHAWRELLERHDAIVREQLGRWRGREIKTVGDGFLATFDGPARAVRCAHTIVEEVRELGMDVRAGLHTGECELTNGDVRGIAVHIGARVGALAERGQVLVSSTVRDLVVGSDLRFEDRGQRPLRGVPGEWRLFSLSPGAAAA
jgi:class 3 adenylate cyclase